MSDWTHVLMIAVPELLIAQANQLALAIGTIEDDVNTFRTADWTDGTNFYAVANTKAVDQIIEHFALVPVELASGVVFPTISISTEGITTLSGSDMTKVQVFVDTEPLAVFSLLNLTRRDVAEIEA